MLALLAAAGCTDDIDSQEQLAVAEPLRFARACEAGERLTLAAVGDVLLHGPLQKQAYAGEDGFLSLWEEVGDLLAGADVTYANLEGPTAAGVNASGASVTDPGPVFDGVVYTSYPMFNYHPSLLGDLRATGVDVVSTANNHSLDRRSLGVDRTIEALEEAELPYTGTRHSAEPASPWFTFTDNGFRIAWLACTYGTNGIPDNREQVLGCYEDTAEIETLVRGLAARDDVAAVVVTPHWGQEYTPTPGRSQIDLARRLLDAGATAIVGAHPHVLQPWEKYLTRDGRETFIIYSLGNFVSNQSQLPRRSTLLLYLGFTLDGDGKAFVNGARYVPMYMATDPDGRRSLRAVDRSGGPSSSRALTVGMFGEERVQPPDEAIDTTPECR